MVISKAPGMILKYPTLGTKFNIAIKATMTPANAIAVIRLFLKELPFSCFFILLFLVSI